MALVAKINSKTIFNSFDEQSCGASGKEVLYKKE